MAVLAQNINPRKKFRWAIECDGVETAYCQKIKPSKTEVKTAKHGDGPFNINTASKVEFTPLEIDSLMPAETAGVWWKDWLALIINLGNGAMGDPSVYKKTLFIVYYASDGETIVDRTEYQGCFPMDIDPGELDKLAEDNLIDKMKISVDRVVLQNS